MKRHALYSLVLSGIIISSPSYALLNLNKVDANSIASAIDNALEQVQGNDQLASQIDQQLTVTPTQAAGGAGALLALAQNQLSEKNNAELGKLIPGIDQFTSLNVSGQSNLMSSINTLGDVNSAFTQLGLSSEMVSQYAPLLLQYLSQQKASVGLMNALSDLWGVK